MKAPDVVGRELTPAELLDAERLVTDACCVERDAFAALASASTTAELRLAIAIARDAMELAERLRLGYIEALRASMWADPESADESQRVLDAILIDEQTTIAADVLVRRLELAGFEAMLDQAPGRGVVGSA